MRRSICCSIVRTASSRSARFKYSAKPFTIDKQYAKSLQAKTRVFAAKTKTKKQITAALISAHGLVDNLYADELISSVVTLEDLFAAQI